MLGYQHNRERLGVRTTERGCAVHAVTAYHAGFQAEALVVTPVPGHNGPALVHPGIEGIKLRRACVIGADKGQLLYGQAQPGAHAFAVGRAAGGAGSVGKGGVKQGLGVALERAFYLRSLGRGEFG